MTNEMRYFIEWRILVCIITFHIRERENITKYLPKYFKTLPWTTVTVTNGL